MRVSRCVTFCVTCYRLKRNLTASFDKTSGLDEITLINDVVRMKTLRVSCPEIFMAVVSLTPRRVMLRIALLQKSCRFNPTYWS